MPWLIFLVLAAVKLLTIASRAVGPSGTDEPIYLRMAASIARARLYTDPQFPPLFPAAVAPAFAFENVYPAAIALMCIYSAALVIPTWFIGREIMGVRYAALPTLVVAVIPFQYSVAGVVMSENLFYPLLLTVVCLVISTRARNLWARDALTGLAIAAAYLTRYMMLIWVPALAIAWLLRERAQGRRLLDRAVLGRAALLTVVSLLPVAAWVVAQISFGASFSQALGADVGLGAGAIPAEARTALRFARFGIMYLASWCLWLAPALGAVWLSFARVRRAGLADALSRLTVLTGLMGTTVWVIATRHAYKAGYNWPEPLRILDRYCFYLVALGAIIAIGYAVHAAKEPPVPAIRSWLVGAVLPAAAIAASWWIVMRWGFVPAPNPGTPGIAASDTYHVFTMGLWFWPLALGAPVLAGRLMAQRRRTSAGVITALLIAFMVVGAPSYIERLYRVTVSQVHAARLAPLVNSTYPAAESVTVSISPAASEASGRTDRSLRNRLRVKLAWATGKRHPVGLTTDPAYSRAGFAVLLLSEAPRDAVVLSRYEFGDEIYAIISPAAEETGE